MNGDYILYIKCSIGVQNEIIKEFKERENWVGLTGIERDGWVKSRIKEGSG